MDLLKLLGIPPNDAMLTRFVGSLGERPEIEADDDEAYLEFQASGLSLLFIDNTRLAAVTVFADGEDGFDQFKGPLPHGLSFDLDAATVHQRLGPPTESDEGGNYPVLGVVPPRDVYWLPDHSLNVQYSPDRGRVTQITLMTVQDSPGRKPGS